jgi:dipeptidyl aminopeptidase/acylaminoacyl peptidase
MRRAVLLEVFLLALSAEPVVFAQQTAGGMKPPTPEALLGLRRLSDPEFSPDGTRVAFVVTEGAKGEERQRHIWLFETATGAFRRLTYSEKAESSPKWSPDGKWLAFLSNRAASQQIYLLPMSGGESRPLTKGNRGVDRFAWAPDGGRIAFLAPDAKTDAEEKKEKDKDDARVVDKQDKHARLWLIDVSGEKERALTPANFAVSELAWFPDGRSIAVMATDRPESDRNTERIFKVEAGTPDPPAMNVLFAPRGPFENLAIAPSGGTLSFVGARDDGPSPHDLWLLPAGAGAAKNLTAASLDRPVSSYRWTKTGVLWLLAEEGFTTRLVRYTAEGAREDLPPLQVMASSFAVNPAGSLAFVGESATEPQELWFGSPGEPPKKFPAFNRAFEAFSVGRPELYRYKSFDGQEIEAALLKPAGHDGSSKLPVVALIHGGPTGAWQSSIDSWGQLLASRGYAVFYPNIRGSTGYGEKFVESNRGDWGGNDFKDVVSGLDDLIARGIADPDRLGIGGWSYGGFMSEWAVTQTTRFRAAVSGAGMANLISEYGTEEHPAYDEWFWSLPYEKPDGFLNHSPFLYLKNVKTPTLILQGDADTVDPLGQSQELYRGLKRYGVETELVVYPREPHGLREEKHLIDRLNRVLDWYDRHMK